MESRVVAMARSFAVCLSLTASACGATHESAPAPWGTGYLKHPSDWYATATARAVADSVLQYQSPQGGWPKSTNLALPPRTPDDIPPEGRGRANSLDNEATTLPMEFLARVATATGDGEFRAAFLRGVDYLLAAQYPNGGWPQFWPLRGDYYDHITYNDGAMIRVMSLLRDVAAGGAPFAFVDKERRRAAAEAVARGVDCILRTQIRQEGVLTVWCAQHDERTFEPAWARKYEPPSFSGSESVGIVRFLMSVEKPTPEIIAAVEGGVEWLRSVAMTGVRHERIRGADGRLERRLVPDPAAPPLWARFYELGTNRPLYLDRDSVFLYDYSEVGHERRSGYDYHGEWAASLLAKEYPAWRAKHALPRPFTPLKLNQVRGLALDRAGNLYLPDLPTSTLYRITPAGEFSIVPTAPIVQLHAVTAAPDGTIYAVETEVSRVHRLDANGATPLVPHERKDVFLGATSIVFDAAGNLYIGENDVNIVRKLTPSGEFSIYAGAHKVPGNNDGSAAEARFTRPRALAIDGAGNIFVGDEAAHIVRKITPGGVVTTLAGLAGERGSADGVGAMARFNSPRGLATDTAGNVYVMDTNNAAVRKITPDGTVTTFAGKAGEPGFVDGAASAARFNGLRAGVVDSHGNLIVADEGNAAVRQISPEGIVTTIAGVRPPHKAPDESAPAKPKVIVMTDGEIDDHSSMIRFLLYTCDVDVQAIIETNSMFQRTGHSKESWYEDQLAAYQAIHPNLIKHHPGYPTADELQARSFVGDEDFEHLKGTRETRWEQIPGAPVEFDPAGWPDTPGSDAIVRILLQDDPAPVHLQAWGGGNTASRAFHKLKTEHPADYERAVSKVVMYNIWYQDDAGNYIETHHPLVTMIYCGHFAGTWNYRSQPATTDFITRHVKNDHGPLGALYPQTYISEGDSPAFFYVVANGLRNHEHPGFGGWGGRFKKVAGFERVYIDAEDEGGKKFQLARWIDAVNRDFEARMDWCVEEFNNANHAPVARVGGGLVRTAKPGETVRLDASGTTDPDGNRLIFRWWQYHEAGTAETKVIIANADSPTPSFVAPNEPGQQLHLILEVTDDGAPSLVGYQRVIVTIDR